MLFTAFSTPNCSVSIARECTEEEAKSYVKEMTGIHCRKIKIFDGEEVVFDYDREESAPIHRKADIVFAPIRKMTERDKKWANFAVTRSLLNLNMDDLKY